MKSDLWDYVKLFFIIAVVVAAVIYFAAAYADPCTRPQPTAQTILDCQTQKALGEAK